MAEIRRIQEEYRRMRVELTHNLKLRILLKFVFLFCTFSSHGKSSVIITFPCPKLLSIISSPQGVYYSADAVEARLTYLAAADANAIRAAVRRHTPLLFKRNLPSADIQAAILKHVGPKPTVKNLGEEIVYENGFGTTVVENPITGTFRIEKFERLIGKNSFLDPDGVEVPEEKSTFNYSVASHGLTGSAEANLKIARALAFEYGDGKPISDRIQFRIDRFSEAWKQRTLNNAIGKFCGSDGSVIHNGSKVIILNRKTNVFILDDPRGQYYRIFKIFPNGEEVPLDWDGRAVLGVTQNDHEKTHFGYSSKEDDLNTVDRLQSYLLEKNSKVLHSNFSYFPEPEPQSIKLDTAPTILALQQVMDRNKPVERIEALEKLRWVNLSSASQSKLLQHSRTYTYVDVAAIEKTLPIILESQDPLWAPVVENWIRFLRRGDEIRVRNQAQKVLGILQPVKETPIFLKALYDRSEFVRVGILNSLTWKDFPDEQQEEILRKARGISNSYEIGNYIRIASESGDKRWIPILADWVRAWEFSPRNSWQRYKCDEARRAISVLEM